MAADPLAVLFDMDGLLVDTEPVWFAVERDTFARLGATRPWTRADADGLVGNALPVSAATMRDRAGATVEVDVVTGWFVDGMAARLAHGVPWKPGAASLLASLREEGVQTALVSSSYRRLVDVVAGSAPASTFTVTVAGDEVPRGKPHPDPYLRAMDLLGVAASECVVLEDSPTGARAGAAAGCRVVVVPDRAPLPVDHDWVVASSLTEVSVDLLRGLLGGDGGEHVEAGGPAGRDDRGEDADQR
jgi:HAD superfamily hydrolase (TIGR01509 family)